MSVFSAIRQGNWRKVERIMKRYPETDIVEGVDIAQGQYISYDLSPQMIDSIFRLVGNDQCKRGTLLQSSIRHFGIWAYSRLLDECLKRDINLNRYDRSRPSPLLESLSNAHDRTASLLDKGARPDATFNGKCCLTTVIERTCVRTAMNNEAIVHQLLDRGARPDGYGNTITPLMAAVIKRSLAIVKLLLESGGEPSMVSHEGKTAVQYTKKIQDPDLRMAITNLINSYPSSLYMKKDRSRDYMSDFYHDITILT